MNNVQLYYYRIFDDKEEFSYIKSSMDHLKVEKLVKDFEQAHEKYLNPDLVDYLQKFDPEAELILVSDISY
jgi:hypothetical protein